MLFQHRQVDHILAVVVEQQLERRAVADRLITVPEARRIPAADAGGGARNAQHRLDTLEAAAQPALPADVQQIAVIEVTLEVGVEPPADDRQVEAGAIESHYRLDAVERVVERHVAHTIPDELDRPAVGAIDA